MKKRKLKNYLKLGILLFGVFIFLWSCQKEDAINNVIIESETVKQAFKTRLVISTEIPSIMDLVNKETRNIYSLDNNLKKSTENENNYGDLDLENIIETIDTLGNTNYSFKITNINSNQFSIHNLIVHKDQDGNIDTPYVIKYTMTEDFATEYYLGNKHFGEFTGTRAHYLLDAFLNNQSSSNSLSTQAKGTPTLDCPCDEAIFTSEGNTDTSGNNSGSNTTGTSGTVTSITSSTSGGGLICFYAVVTTPCSCAGHTNPRTCTCATPPIVTIDLLYCASQRSSSTKAESEDCEIDVNGLCPEDNGYVGVNAISGAGNFIETKIVDSNLDPCSKEILTNLKNLETNDIANILNRFGSPTSIYDWEIKTGIPTNANNVAETDWKRDSNNIAQDYEYETIVKLSYVNSTTKIAIARTILHEMLHAYILSHIDDVQNGNTSGFLEFRELWRLIQQDLTGFNNNPEPVHHEFMASKFISPLKDALKEWDSSSQPNEYYEDLAWGALIETDTFDHFYPVGSSNRNRIINTNLAEDTNSTQGGISPKSSACN